MKRLTALIAAGTLVIAPLTMLSAINPAKAASLIDVTVRKDATNDFPASTAAQTVKLTFTPVTAITNTSIIEVSYDTGFTGGAALGNGDITVSGTNITSGSTTCSGFLAGYFRCALATTGNVTTAVTIDIDNDPGLTSPAAGVYNWSVSVDIGAAGTTFDQGAGLAYVADENDVTVSAAVPYTLDLEIYGRGTTSLLNPNTCPLGVLSISTAKSCSYDVGASTNDTAGYTIKMVADGDLRNGADVIAEVSDGNVVSGGSTSEYGFAIRTNATSCGTVTTAYDDATAEYAVPVAADTEPTKVLASTNSTCNGATAANTSQRYYVEHVGGIAADQKATTYSQVVTYTAFTN